MSKDLSSLPVGTVLKGKYRIKSHLSSGGFGKTYLAEYSSRNTKVAIKEFFMTTANQREADGVTVSVDRTKENAGAFGSQLAKFKKEYERLKLINNVHVVKVHECFEENGTAYYVMDFVEGDDLKGRLKQRGTPYAEKTVLGYLKQILDGLAAIHSAGLLHLDLKPSNLMVTRHGYIKLIDLGASKDYMQGEGATVLSNVAVTNRYAPPEQMDGSYSKLGPWTDFYALGATLYQLLTWHEIPTGSELKEDRTIDKRNSLPMPGISEETKSLVVWLMNTDREKRPHSVSEIKTKLSAKKTTSSSYDETTVLSDVTEEATVVVERPKARHQSSNVTCQSESYRPSNNRNSTPRQNAKQEPEPEFSFVGCLYILIIIAIVVCIVKFLFLS